MKGKNLSLVNNTNISNIHNSKTNKIIPYENNINFIDNIQKSIDKKKIQKSNISNISTINSNRQTIDNNTSNLNNINYHNFTILKKDKTHNLGNTLFKGQKFTYFQEPFNESIKPIKSSNRQINNNKIKNFDLQNLEENKKLYLHSFDQDDNENELKIIENYSGCSVDENEGLEDDYNEVSKINLNKNPERYNNITNHSFNNNKSNSTRENYFKEKLYDFDKESLENIYNSGLTNKYKDDLLTKSKYFNNLNMPLHNYKQYFDSNFQEVKNNIKFNTPEIKRINNSSKKLFIVPQNLKKNNFQNNENKTEINNLFNYNPRDYNNTNEIYNDVVNNNLDDKNNMENIKFKDFYKTVEKNPRLIYKKSQSLNMNQNEVKNLQNINNGIISENKNNFMKLKIENENFNKIQSTSNRICDKNESFKGEDSEKIEIDLNHFHQILLEAEKAINPNTFNNLNYKIKNNQNKKIQNKNSSDNLINNPLIVNAQNNTYSNISSIPQDEYIPSKKTSQNNLENITNNTNIDFINTLLQLKNGKNQFYPNNNNNNNYTTMTINENNNFKANIIPKIDEDSQSYIKDIIDICSEKQNINHRLNNDVNFRSIDHDGYNYQNNNIDKNFKQKNFNSGSSNFSQQRNFINKYISNSVSPLRNKDHPNNTEEIIYNSAIYPDNLNPNSEFNNNYNYFNKIEGNCEVENFYNHNENYFHIEDINLNNFKNLNDKKKNESKSLKTHELIEITQRRKNLVNDISSVDGYFRRRHLETMVKMERMKKEKENKDNTENNHIPRINKKSKEIAMRIGGGSFHNVQFNQNNQVIVNKNKDENNLNHIEDGIYLDNYDYIENCNFNKNNLNTVAMKKLKTNSLLVEKNSILNVIEDLKEIEKIKNNFDEYKENDINTLNYNLLSNQKVKNNYNKINVEFKQKRHKSAGHTNYHYDQISNNKNSINENLNQNKLLKTQNNHNNHECVYDKAENNNYSNKNFFEFNQIEIKKKSPKNLKENKNNNYLNNQENQINKNFNLNPNNPIINLEINNHLFIPPRNEVEIKKDYDTLYNPNIQKIKVFGKKNSKNLNLEVPELKNFISSSTDIVNYGTKTNKAKPIQDLKNLFNQDKYNEDFFNIADNFNDSLTKKFVFSYDDNINEIHNNLKKFSPTVKNFNQKEEKIRIIPEDISNIYKNINQNIENNKNSGQKKDNIDIQKSALENKSSVDHVEIDIFNSDISISRISNENKENNYLKDLMINRTNEIEIDMGMSYTKTSIQLFPVNEKTDNDLDFNMEIFTKENKNSKSNKTNQNFKNNQIQNETNINNIQENNYIYQANNTNYSREAELSNRLNTVNTVTTVNNMNDYNNYKLNLESNRISLENSEIVHAFSEKNNKQNKSTAININMNEYKKNPYSNKDYETNESPFIDKMDNSPIFQKIEINKKDTTTISNNNHNNQSINFSKFTNFVGNSNLSNNNITNNLINQNNNMSNNNTTLNKIYKKPYIPKIFNQNNNYYQSIINTTSKISTTNISNKNMIQSYLSTERNLSPQGLMDKSKDIRLNNKDNFDNDHLNPLINISLNSEKDKSHPLNDNLSNNLNENYQIDLNKHNYFEGDNNIFSTKANSKNEKVFNFDYNKINLYINIDANGNSINNKKSECFKNKNIIQLNETNEEEFKENKKKEINKIEEKEKILFDLGEEENNNILISQENLEINKPSKQQNKANSMKINIINTNNNGIPFNSINNPNCCIIKNNTTNNFIEIEDQENENYFINNNPDTVKLINPKYNNFKNNIFETIKKNPFQKNLNNVKIINNNNNIILGNNINSKNNFRIISKNNSKNSFVTKKESQKSFETKSINSHDRYAHIENEFGNIENNSKVNPKNINEKNSNIPIYKNIDSTNNMDYNLSEFTSKPSVLNTNQNYINTIHDDEILSVLTSNPNLNYNETKSKFNLEINDQEKNLFHDNKILNIDKNKELKESNNFEIEKNINLNENKNNLIKDNSENENQNDNIEIKSNKINYENNKKFQFKKKESQNYTNIKNNEINKNSLCKNRNIDNFKSVPNIKKNFNTLELCNDIPKKNDIINKKINNLEKNKIIKNNIINNDKKSSIIGNKNEKKKNPFSKTKTKSQPNNEILVEPIVEKKDKYQIIKNIKNKINDNDFKKSNPNLPKKMSTNNNNLSEKSQIITITKNELINLNLNNKKFNTITSEDIVISNNQKNPNQNKLFDITSEVLDLNFSAKNDEKNKSKTENSKFYCYTDDNISIGNFPDDDNLFSIEDPNQENKFSIRTNIFSTDENLENKNINDPKKNYVKQKSKSNNLNLMKNYNTTKFSIEVKRDENNFQKINTEKDDAINLETVHDMNDIISKSVKLHRLSQENYQHQIKNFLDKLQTTQENQEKNVLNEIKDLNFNESSLMKSGNSSFRNEMEQDLENFLKKVSP